MKDVPQEVAEAMQRALDEAETQLRAGAYRNHLGPRDEYPAWTFDGPGRWLIYVEGIPQSQTEPGVRVELTAYAQGGRRKATASRTVTLATAT